MSSPVLRCLAANIHQGDSSFSFLSRGKQCSFISLSCLMHSQLCAVPMWTEEILNEIICHGDAIYMCGLENKLFTGDVDLLISDLPVVSNCWTGKRWAINYNHYYQGLLRPVCQNTDEDTLPELDQRLTFGLSELNESLVNAFRASSTAIVILNGFMMAAIKYGSEFYPFSHARSSTNGMPLENGFAVLLKFRNIPGLEMHLKQLSIQLGTKQFEIIVVILNSDERRNEKDTVKCEHENVVKLDHSYSKIKQVRSVKDIHSVKKTRTFMCKSKPDRLQHEHDHNYASVCKRLSNLSEISPKSNHHLKADAKKRGIDLDKSNLKPIKRESRKPRTHVSFRVTGKMQSKSRSECNGARKYTKRKISRVVTPRSVYLGQFNSKRHGPIHKQCFKKHR